jgi:chemotaxis protein MotB
VRLLIVLSLMVTGCVPKADYMELETRFNTTSEESEARAERLAELEMELGRLRSKAAELDAESRRLQAKIEEANAEKAALLDERSDLEASVEEMEAALNELARRQAAAERRLADYKDLLARFKSLIDAGQLRVKIVDGQMVVELSTDILFDSGSAALSKDGKAAISEVGEVLAGIEGRRFQVTGHTDNVPIATAQYPSNWELASARAITVVKQLIEAGLAPEQVSGASFGETQPISDNETKEGRAANRRIEIIVVPDLSTLPGYEELSQAVAGGDEASDGKGDKEQPLPGP